MLTSSGGGGGAQLSMLTGGGKICLSSRVCLATFELSILKVFKI